jgi:iron complex transport system substrate-binding protein
MSRNYCWTLSSNWRRSLFGSRNDSQSPLLTCSSARQSLRLSLRWTLPVVLFWIVGCSMGAPTRERPAIAQQTLVDGMGREVTLPLQPRRIISLAPNLTEILFALGLDAEIVGVTSYCDFPAQATERPKVGDTLAPNLEAILKLRPDLVVVSTASQLEPLTRRLTELSIPVFVSHPQTVVGILESIHQIGAATGRMEAAAAVVGEMRARIDHIETRVARLPRLRVLYVLQTQPLITVGRDTFLDDLIRLAGGESISAGEVGYPQFSRETVLREAPEVVLFPAHHGQTGDRQLEATTIRQIFATTPAIRDNRLHQIHPDWANRPGPRIVDALEQFAQAIHPESP